jgi:hypothetical protein
MSLPLYPRGTSDLAAPKAPQACGACRKQKRRCDKALPACSLCTRMSRPCDYTDIASPAPTADDFAALQMKLAELEGRLNGGGSGNGVGSGGRGSSSASVEEPPPVFTPGQDPLWQGAVSQLPSVIFLDLDAFGWMNMTLSKPSVDIPAVSLLSASL